ncbi:MAG: hypothetical protein U0M02_02480 [Acutalibacteraceae bacterium]|nr:hypothetical protein [Acutalibacteraceae bacterium]
MNHTVSDIAYTYKLPETVTIDLDGKKYSCDEVIKTDEYGMLPVLNVKMMSPEEERELVERQKKLHPELYAEYAANKERNYRI